MGWLGTLLLLMGALLLLLTAIGNLQRKSAEEGKKQLEQSLNRATVSCYALEGIYPPNLDYLKQHYGIQVNEERYTVFYDSFGDNLMPDITVLPK